MSKPLSIALAAAIAISTIGLAVAPANAGHRNRGDQAAIAIFSAIAGLALSQAYRPHYYYYPPPPRPYYPSPSYRYYGGGPYDAHVQWCLDRYRTYNPATNTYFRRPGVPAVCHSPFG